MHTGRGFAQTVEVSLQAIQIVKIVIRRTSTATAVKFFTQFIARLKIVSRPIRSNRVSSKLNVLDIVIRSINIHVCTKLFKYYNIPEFLYSKNLRYIVLPFRHYCSEQSVLLRAACSVNQV